MKRSLKLMPERAYRREQIRRSLKLWSRVLLGVLALLLLGGVAQWQRYSHAASRRAAAESAYDPVRQLKVESTRLTKQLKLVESTELIPLALANHQPLLGLIGLAAQAVQQQSDKVYLQRIEIERDPLTPITAEQPNLTFTLEGEAAENGAIALLAESLRTNGPFIKVTTDTEQSTSGQTQQAFTIECIH